MSSTNAHVDNEIKNDKKNRADSSSEDEILNDSSLSSPPPSSSDTLENPFKQPFVPSSTARKHKPKILTRLIKIKAILAFFAFIVLVVSSLAFALKGDHETSRKIFTLLTAQVIPALNDSLFYTNCNHTLNNLLCRRVE
jgi:hypothetical protein